MESYKGYITINGQKYPFIFTDYLLSIVIGKKDRNIVDWSNIKQIVCNGWIHVRDFDYNEFYIKVDHTEYLGLNEFGFHAQGYIQMLRFHNSNDSENSDALSFECQTMEFKHEIIDYFFKRDKTFIDKVITLLKEWKDNSKSSNKPTERKPFHFNIKDNSYKLQFRVLSHFDYAEPFPFKFYNTLVVQSDHIMSIDDVFEVALNIKMFLMLISHSRIVNFDEIYLDLDNRADKAYAATLYLRPECNFKVSKERVFDYENIEMGIENLLDQIITNKICFRSLLNYHENEINTSDIMNVCAAFESQFGIHYPKFVNKHQKQVKRKMVTALENMRANYLDEEKIYFDDILKGLKYYNDTFQNKLDLALAEFEQIYGEKIGFDFFENYKTFPKRMKETRNALDHGNRDYIITNQMLMDVELLRAITYMLILKEAGIDDNNIKKCLIKMSRWPFGYGD